MAMREQLRPEEQESARSDLIDSGYSQALNEIEVILPNDSFADPHHQAQAGRILQESIRIARDEIRDETETSIDDPREAKDLILGRARRVLSDFIYRRRPFPSSDPSEPSLLVSESERPVYNATHRILSSHIELSLQESMPGSGNSRNTNLGLSRMRDETARYITRYVPLQDQERVYDVAIMALNNASHTLREGRQYVSPRDPESDVRHLAEQNMVRIGQERFVSGGNQLRRIHESDPVTFNRAYQVLHNIGLGRTSILGAIPRRME